MAVQIGGKRFCLWRSPGRVARDEPDDADVMSLGDLNAYFQEDPIDLLEAAGYENLQERIADPYSYVFDGQIGSLDYILANQTLGRQVTGVTEWHINADEADALDYNLDFGRDPDYFDGDVAARVSDHDPCSSASISAARRARSPAPTGPTTSPTTPRSPRRSGPVTARTCCGLDGADALFGRNGQDQLFGGSGQDRLAGENGVDYLEGGAGADVFVFARVGGSDIVADFTLAGGDRLELADGMRIIGAREIDTDGQGGADATELQFNGASVTLLGVTGVTNPDALLV